MNILYSQNTEKEWCASEEKEDLFSPVWDLVIKEWSEIIHSLFVLQGQSSLTKELHLKASGQSFRPWGPHVYRHSANKNPPPCVLAVASHADRVGVLTFFLFYFFFYLIAVHVILYIISSCVTFYFPPPVFVCFHALCNWVCVGLFLFVGLPVCSLWLLIVLIVLFHFLRLSFAIHSLFAFWIWNFGHYLAFCSFSFMPLHVLHMVPFWGNHYSSCPLLFV